MGPPEDGVTILQWTGSLFLKGEGQHPPRPAYRMSHEPSGIGRYFEAQVYNTLAPSISTPSTNAGKHTVWPGYHWVPVPWLIFVLLLKLNPSSHQHQLSITSHFSAKLGSEDRVIIPQPLGQYAYQCGKLLEM